jgi:hypothetical protein
MNYGSRRHFMMFLLSLALLSPVGFAADKKPRTIQDVSQNARLRDKVVVQGTIRRRINFDLFIAEDASGPIGLSFEGLRQRLRIGDTIVVAGKFQGRYVLEGRIARLDVISFAAPGTPDAAALIEKFGEAPAAPQAPETSPSPAPVRSIEDRLRRLDELRDKKLVTPEEYAEQRKRILGDL